MSVLTIAGSDAWTHLSPSVSAAVTNTSSKELPREEVRWVRVREPDHDLDWGTCSAGGGMNASRCVGWRNTIALEERIAGMLGTSLTG